jgi:hypothetical protein
MPAQAGIPDFFCCNKGESWIAACAGMTTVAPPKSRSFGRLV